MIKEFEKMLFSNSVLRNGVSKDTNVRDLFCLNQILNKSLHRIKGTFHWFYINKLSDNELQGH